MKRDIFDFRNSHIPDNLQNGIVRNVTNNYALIFSVKIVFSVQT